MFTLADIDVVIKLFQFIEVKQRLFLICELLV